MGLCSCGCFPITEENIDVAEYFELCKPCREDYDFIAEKKENKKKKSKSNVIEIPEFWKEDEV